MSIKFNDLVSQATTSLLANASLLFLYFITIFYCSSLWVFLLTSISLIVLFIACLFKRRICKKCLLFFAPALTFLLILICIGKAHYLGSWLEYQIRKKDFIRDIKTARKNNKLTSEIQWPSWNANAITMRDFIYSEKPMPTEDVMKKKNNDCRRLSEKLDDSFYIFYFVDCSGPLL